MKQSKCNKRSKCKSKRNNCKTNIRSKQKRYIRSKQKRYTKKRYTIRSKHIKRSKRTGGSRVYDMDSYDFYSIPEQTPDGKDFFRKVFSKKKDNINNETDIISYLMNFPDYTQNNIVTVYNVTQNYVDMEELHTPLTPADKTREYIAAMRKAKDFLQSNGIVYLDWKADNIGMSEGKSKSVDGSMSEGGYKLFDFDASGIFNPETNEWLIEPIYLATYDHRLTPTELDDSLFEENIVQKPIPETYEDY